jgi:hypothetical protein
MTPKEKAIELSDKFYFISSFFSDLEDAKECALIAVDEILNLTKIASIRRDEVYMELEYWQEVKEQIEKL